ncbi:MAG: SapC family protein [Deltaproteobacteria bacterium]|nr:SapC family protein [Deltaproteobacteria bacterium]
MSKILPVSSKNLGGKRLLPITSYLFAQKESLVSLTATEFPVAAQNFPIVFSRHHEHFGVFVLLGVEKGENLFVDAAGRWLGDYIPATLRRYPFIYAKPEGESAELVLCIDEGSGLLNESGGEPLFDRKGDKTPALEKALNFINEYQKSAQAAEVFSRALRQKDLLVPLDLQVKTGEKTAIKVEGLLRVDDARFNNLSNNDFLELRGKGFLPLIYLHFFSLAKIHDLIARKKARGKVASKHEESPTQFGDLFKF